MHRYNLLGIAFVIAAAILFSGENVAIQLSLQALTQGGLLPTGLLLSPLDVAIIAASAVLFVAGCILVLYPFEKKR